MTDEEKKAADEKALADKAAAEALAASQGKQDDSVDYKSELEKVKTELSKAQFTIQTIKKEKKEKKDDDNDGSDDDDSKVDPKELIADAERRLEQKFLKREIDATISSVSTSEEEAELIRFHLEHSIKPTGDVAQDILNAKVLANRKVFETRMSEVANALKSKDSKSKSADGASQEENSGEPMKLNALEEAILKRRNMTAKDVKTN